MAFQYRKHFKVSHHKMAHSSLVSLERRIGVWVCCWATIPWKEAACPMQWGWNMCSIWFKYLHIHESLHNISSPRSLYLHRITQGHEHGCRSLVLKCHPPLPYRQFHTMRRTLHDDLTILSSPIACRASTNKWAIIWHLEDSKLHMEDWVEITTAGILACSPHEAPLSTATSRFSTLGRFSKLLRIMRLL